MSRTPPDNIPPPRQGSVTTTPSGNGPPIQVTAPLPQNPGNEAAQNSQQRERVVNPDAAANSDSSTHREWVVHHCWRVVRFSAKIWSNFLTLLFVTINILIQIHAFISGFSFWGHLTLFLLPHHLQHLMSFIFMLSNSLYFISDPNWRSDSKMSFRLFQQPRGWYLYFVIIYTLSTSSKSEEFINVARLRGSVLKSKPIFGPCSS